jgi:hypothetical protein
MHARQWRRRRRQRSRPMIPWQCRRRLRTAEPNLALAFAAAVAFAALPAAVWPNEWAVAVADEKMKVRGDCRWWRAALRHRARPESTQSRRGRPICGPWALAAACRETGSAKQGNGHNIQPHTGAGQVSSDSGIAMGDMRMWQRSFLSTSVLSEENKIRNRFKQKPKDARQRHAANATQHTQRQPNKTAKEANYTRNAPTASRRDPTCTHCAPSVSIRNQRREHTQTARANTRRAARAGRARRPSSDRAETDTAAAGRRQMCGVVVRRQSRIRDETKSDG